MLVLVLVLVLVLIHVRVAAKQRDEGRKGHAASKAAVVDLRKEGTVRRVSGRQQQQQQQRQQQGQLEHRAGERRLHSYRPGSDDCCVGRGKGWQGQAPPLKQKLPPRGVLRHSATRTKVWQAFRG